MKTAEINPYIRLAIHSELPVPFFIKRRVIFDYELLYVEDGQMILEYSGASYNCTRGDIILLCPGVPHSFTVLEQNLVQPHIHFDMAYDHYSEAVYINYKDYPEMDLSERAMIRENIYANQDYSPIIRITDKDAFLSTFFRVIDSNQSSAVKSLSRKGNMLTLIETILTENPSSELSNVSVNSDMAKNIRSFILSNFLQKVSLDMLSQHFGYSKFYIEKVFKKAYGISVISFWNRKRLETAAEMLRTHTVGETAHILGYSSIYAFSKAFKAFYRLSPSDFKRSDKSVN